MTLLVGQKASAMLDDINGYKGLFASVIKQAIFDSMIVQDRSSKKLNPIVESAFEFLFGEDIDLYLHFLDIDKNYFQKHTVKQMFDKETTGHVITEVKRRQFRINYKKWVQEKNKKLIFMATYKVQRR
jgi:hypothetical protein